MSSGTEFLDWFFDKYKSRYRINYVSAGTRDTADANWLVQRAQIDDLKPATEAMFYDAWAGNRASIGLLRSQIDKWLQAGKDLKNKLAAEEFRAKIMQTFERPVQRKDTFETPLGRTDLGAEINKTDIRTIRTIEPEDFKEHEEPKEHYEHEELEEPEEFKEQDEPERTLMNQKNKKVVSQKNSETNNLSLAEILEIAILEDRRDQQNIETRKHSPLFIAVQNIKSYYQDGHSPEQAFDEIDPLVKKKGGWPKCFIAINDDDDAFARFIVAWGKVKFCKGLLKIVAGAAAKTPLTISYSGNVADELKRFISFAGWLQVYVGAMPIGLPLREVGEALGYGKDKAQSFRGLAEAYGFLKLAAEHVFDLSKKEKNKARSYWIDVRQFPELTSRINADLREALEAQFPPGNQVQ